MDLQFDEKMIRAAKGDISEQIKDLYPSYVVFITIQQGQKIADKKNKEKFAVQEPRLDVNTEFFSPIREKD